MFRNNLQRISCRENPGYLVKAYQEGDEKYWNEICKDAFGHAGIDEDLFDWTFMRKELLPERQYYVIHNHQFIATATAWYGWCNNNIYTARLHWIAVKKDFQGEGWGSMLLNTMLFRMRQLGYFSVYLETHLKYEDGILFYLKHGFEPVFRCYQDFEEWNKFYESRREKIS